MLVDVVKNILPGRTRAEIEEILGPSLETSYFKSTGRDLIYGLGPQRDSYFSIDSEWLLTYQTRKEIVMSITHIRQSIENVIKYLFEHPGECRYTDKAATAVLEEGLRCRADGPSGATLISDMPKAIGGGGLAPSPGWLLRAALANCDTTVIAMRAAQLGVTLSTLEVTVDSESDDRGLLGMDDTISAGPLGVRTRVRIGADGVAPARLREIVEWAEAHSPVGDAIRRAILSKVEVEIA